MKYVNCVFNSNSNVQNIKNMFRTPDMLILQCLGLAGLVCRARRCRLRGNFRPADRRS